MEENANARDAEKVIIPGGSAVPVPAVEDASVIGGKETEAVKNKALHDLFLNIFGSSPEENISDDEIVTTTKSSAVAVPAVEEIGGLVESGAVYRPTLYSSGSSDHTSHKDMVVILNEGSAVAIPDVEDASLIGGDDIGAVEIEAPHLPTLNSGGLTMEDDASDAEMVIIPGESAVAVPVVEVASVIGGDETGPTLHELTLSIGGSSMEGNTSDINMVRMPEGPAVAETVTISGGSAVPTVEDASMVGGDETGALNNEGLPGGSAISVPSVTGGDETMAVKPAVKCDESTMEEKRNDSEMQIALAGLTSSVSDDERDETIPVENEALHQLTFYCGESTMEEKTNEAVMQIVVAGSTVSAPVDDGTSVIGDDVTIPLRIEYAPSDPVVVPATTPTKRKRGRPRKILESPQSPAKVDTASGILLKSPQSPVTFPQKRKVGRPPGTGKLQKLAAAGTCLENLTPHLLTVENGEDVIQRLDAFLKIDQSAVCIISAAGSVSSVHIRSSISYDGVLRHEGKFNLLSISGSHAYNRETGRSSGILNAILSTPSSEVFGGVLADVLVASGVVQVVLGTFKQSEKYIKSHFSGSTSQLNSSMVSGKAPIVETEDESSSSSSN